MSKLGETTTVPSKQIDTFDNPAPTRDYSIVFETEELTCLCPKTGQPDFAKLTIDYIPDKLCIESKSLKLFLWSFREEGHFHEELTNMILDALVDAVKPRYMTITGAFNKRGGISTNVVVEYVADT